MVGGRGFTRPCTQGVGKSYWPKPGTIYVDENRDTVRRVDGESRLGGGY
jgi:hypothetical protein